MFHKAIPAVLLAGGLVFASPVLDGDCSALAIDGFAPGSTATVTLTGAHPNTFATAAISQTPGETVFDLGPLGSLTLCLEGPIGAFPLGVTDENGDLTLEVDVPDLPAVLDIHFFTQAVTSELVFGEGGPPSFDFCTSNTVEVTVE